MKFTRYDFANLFGFSAYAACSLIIPICLYPLAKSLGFPLESGGKGLGGTLQMGRAVLMVVSMLFCGFMAAKIGKPKTLGWSVLLMGTGIMLAAFVPSYGFLLLAVAVAGFGEGIVEGIATPFIQDQHPDRPGQYTNFTHGFWSVGVVGSVLLAGWLLSIGVPWRILVFCTGAATIIPTILYLLPDRKKQLKSPTGEIRAEQVKSETVKILKNSRFWLFYVIMFFAGGAEYCLTFWTASFIRITYPEASMLQSGIGTAWFAGGMIAGRIGSGFLIPQKYLKHLILSMGVFGMIVSLFFPYITTINALYVLLALLGVATAPFWPSVQSYAVEKMPNLDATMLLVLLSCAGVPGCGFFSMFMGVVSDFLETSPVQDLLASVHYFGVPGGELAGFRISFFLVTFCLAGLTFLFWSDGWRKKRD